jgi:uncharacterized protein (TIGR02118 family)
MAKVIAMYRKPADVAAFDRYYYDAHLPIAKRIPGLRGYEVTRGMIGSLDGASPYHLIATLTFDSLDDIQRALASPEGQATAADLGRFASGGVDVYFAETKAV